MKFCTFSPMSELITFSRNPGRLVSDQLLAQPSYAVTTQAHLRAAAALIDHTNGEILAWLHRVEPIAEQRPGTAQISPSQIHALSVLKDCPIDTLLGCLELARLWRLYRSLTQPDRKADIIDRQ